MERNVKIYGIGKCGSKLLLAVDRELVHRAGVDPMACHPGYANLQNRNGISFVHWEDRFSFEDDHPLNVKEKIERLAETWEILMDLAAGSDIIVLAGGIGGITGSNGMSTIADFFGPGRTLVVAFVVTPFKGEGEQCEQNAEACLSMLRSNCDVVVIFSNQRLFETHPKETLGNSFHIIEALFEQLVRKILDAGNADNINFPLDDPDGLLEVYINERPIKQSGLIDPDY